MPTEIELIIIKVVIKNNFDLFGAYYWPGHMLSTMMSFNLQKKQLQASIIKSFCIWVNQGLEKSTILIVNERPITFIEFLL